MNYDIIFMFIVATSVLAIAPGPDNIYVLMQSVVNGRKFGMATTAGLITGCLVHTTLLAFGVSALIKENENLFFSIKCFGAIYMLYLAYTVFRQSDTLKINRNLVTSSTMQKLFKQGFLMNVLNPKVTLFYLAFFPGFLFSDSLSNPVQFYILGFVFMIVSFVVFSFVVILSSSISFYLSNVQKTGFFLKWIQIVTFIGIACYLLIVG